MKRKLLAAVLGAVTILGSASLSWGIVVTLDIMAYNFVVSTGTPLHHVEYTTTTSTAHAQVTPTGIVSDNDGFGGFTSGVPADTLATSGSSGNQWTVDATAQGDFTPREINPSSNATPVFSRYAAFNSNGITNGGAGIAIHSYSETSMSQNFDVFRNNGPSPTNIRLDFDWLYNLTVTPGTGDPPDVAYTYEIFLDALLSADVRPSATYSMVNNSTLIADGVDHLTHVTMTVLNSPVNTTGQFSLIIGDTLDSTGSAVPEPSTFILAGSGLIGLFFMRRRSRA
jgi:hypothetical protein